jgi:hypothetical protein
MRSSAGTRLAQRAPDESTSISAGQSGWWAWEDLNLRPHPYQLNAGNRCAHRPFPRSRSTVGAQGMRSIGPLVCLLTIAPAPANLAVAPRTLVRLAASPESRLPTRLSDTRRAGKATLRRLIDHGLWSDQRGCRRHQAQVRFGCWSAGGAGRCGRTGEGGPPGSSGGRSIPSPPSHSFPSDPSGPPGTSSPFASLPGVAGVGWPTP